MPSMIAIQTQLIDKLHAIDAKGWNRMTNAQKANARNTARTALIAKGYSQSEVRYAIKDADDMYVLQCNATE